MVHFNFTEVSRMYINYYYDPSNKNYWRRNSIHVYNGFTNIACCCCYFSVNRPTKFIDDFSLYGYQERSLKIDVVSSFVRHWSLQTRFSVKFDTTRVIKCIEKKTITSLIKAYIKFFYSN